MGQTIPPQRPRQFTFVPVLIENANKQPQVPQLSWWTVCIRWFQYHSVQIRWYFERRVARILHRRWSGK